MPHGGFQRAALVRNVEPTFRTGCQARGRPTPAHIGPSRTYVRYLGLLIRIGGKMAGNKPPADFVSKLVSEIKMPRTHRNRKRPAGTYV